MSIWAMRLTIGSGSRSWSFTSLIASAGQILQYDLMPRAFVFCLEHQKVRVYIFNVYSMGVDYVPGCTVLQQYILRSLLVQSHLLSP